MHLPSPKCSRTLRPRDKTTTKIIKRKDRERRGGEERERERGGRVEKEKNMC